MAEYHDGEKETWNMATATLKRLNALLLQCSYYSQRGDLVGWFKVLRDLRRNLSPFMDESKLEDATTKLKSLPNDWRLNNGKLNPKHYASVHQIFDEVYILFVICMKNKALLMPQATDSGKAITGM